MLSTFTGVAVFALSTSLVFLQADLSFDMDLFDFLKSTDLSALYLSAKWLVRARSKLSLPTSALKACSTTSTLVIVWPMVLGSFTEENLTRAASVYAAPMLKNTMSSDLSAKSLSLA